MVWCEGLLSYKKLLFRINIIGIKKSFLLLIEGPESWKAVAYQLSLAVLEGSENLMVIQMDLWGEPLHAEVLQESDKKRK